MRHTIVPLLALVLATAATAATSPAPSGSGRRPPTPLSAPVYVLSGGGYGHGVGLNQYGALGQAKANRTLPATSSRSTTRERRSTKAAVSTVRVLLADGRPSVKIGSTAAVHGHRRVRSGDAASRRVRSCSSPT